MATIIIVCAIIMSAYAPLELTRLMLLGLNGGYLPIHKFLLEFILIWGSWWTTGLLIGWFEWKRRR